MNKSRILEAIRGGAVDPFLCAKFYKDSPSPPPPPDYVGAAKETSTGNLDAARVAAKANRPDEITPYGNRTWETGIAGDQDRWRGTTTLNPLGQQRFDQEQRINANLGGLAESGIGYVGDKVRSPFDWSRVPDAPSGGQTGLDSAYNAIIDRNQPNQNRDRARQENQLANQGIMRGSEAYTNAERDMSMRENDFRLGAQREALGQQQGMFGMGQTARQQAIQDQSFGRNEPLNMLNALRSGSQVGLPQFQAYGQQGQTAGPNMLGAAQGQGAADQNIYNAQVGATNANNSSTMSTLGTAVTAAAMFY